MADSGHTRLVGWLPPLLRLIALQWFWTIFAVASACSLFGFWLMLRENAPVAAIPALLALCWGIGTISVRLRHPAIVPFELSEALVIGFGLAVLPVTIAGVFIFSHPNTSADNVFLRSVRAGFLSIVLAPFSGLIVIWLMDVLLGKGISSW